jgi:hypothetical protein
VESEFRTTSLSLSTKHYFGIAIPQIEVLLLEDRKISEKEKQQWYPRRDPAATEVL